MIERFIHRLHCEAFVPEEAAEEWTRLKSVFPRKAVRRMSRLGLLVGNCLREVEICSGDSLVYMTSFAESRAIEKYLESFPYASPMLFQTSIHPSAPEQFLIQNNVSLSDFFPLAGSDTIIAQGLKTALTCVSETTVLSGGEERGTWLFDAGVASAQHFAFALSLSQQASGAIGRICWEAEPTEVNEPCALNAFVEGLQQRQEISISNPDLGTVWIEWL